VNDLELVHDIIRRLRPTAYLNRTNDWIRGSLPRSSFRIGSPSSERPGPQVDRTDQDVLAERLRWSEHYEQARAAVEAGLYARRSENYEQPSTSSTSPRQKPGDRDLGGWPCRNYGKRIYGRHCMTDNHDHPDAECVDCRKAKARSFTESVRSGTSKTQG
jgi:hypothetical protein